MSGADRSAISRLTQGFWVLAVVTLIGVVGYLLTGWSLLDAIYMVVITIFGVGYGEVRNLDSPELKIFTIFLIVSGCSALIYILGGFFQLIAEGEFNRAFGNLRMTKQIKQLNDHVIICGFGRIGRVLAEDLKVAQVNVVVVDVSDERIARAAEAGYLVVKGDASHEEVLRQAGIERAKALCSVLPNDAMNVFITLTARNVSSELMLIARGEDPETEPKLLQAGANRVVLPSAIGASQMADMVTRPEVLDFLKKGELRGLDKDLKTVGLAMRTLATDDSCKGRTVGDLEQAVRVSIMVVAIQRKSGEVIERPGLDEALEPGDRVIVITHENVPVSAVRFSTRALSYRGAVVHS